jgi:AcrR family transcriptional regulator
MARPRSFDEQRVLHAVRDQFWNAGYAATSLEDLMRVSGLGKGSLYAAFGDKHQLLLRALRSYTEESAGYLREVLTDTPRALDALRKVVTAPATGSAEAALRGCLMGNSTCELAGADPDVLAHAHQTYESNTELVAGCVRRAQREGDVPTDTDPMILARTLVTAQQGLTFMGRSGMDPGTLAVTAQALAEQLLPG